MELGDATRFGEVLARCGVWMDAGALLTHMGEYQGRRAADVIMGKDVPEATDVVPGVTCATFTGPGRQELLHSAAIAIVGELRLAVLWEAAPSFPTLSEVWQRLLEAYGL